MLSGITWLLEVMMIPIDENLSDIDKGFLAIDDDEYEVAFNIFTVARAQNPNDPDALRGLGSALYNQGLLDEALGVYQDYITRFPMIGQRTKVLA